MTEARHGAVLLHHPPQGLPQDQPRILHQVVLVDLQVASGPDPHPETAVKSHGLQDVRKKGYAGLDPNGLAGGRIRVFPLRRAGLQVELYGYVGFLRLPGEAG